MKAVDSPTCVGNPMSVIRCHILHRSSSRRFSKKIADRCREGQGLPTFSIVRPPHGPDRNQAKASREGYARGPIRSMAKNNQPPEQKISSPEDHRQGQVLTLPTILTLLRVLAIPVLIGVWLSSAAWAPAAGAAIFMGASTTDFLDGYLARKMGVTSAFGAFLDPVADKLMVATVLILLCTKPLPSGPWAGNTWLMPVSTCAVIGREITMSALREWAASTSPEAYGAVAVSQWGKWKTASQMVSLSLLLYTSGGQSGIILDQAAVLGPILLVVAVLLTVASLVEYMRTVWKYVM